MEMSEQINELFAALSKAQLAIQPAVKDRNNTFFKSDYATLNAVWNACRKPLGDNGLAVLQFPHDTTNGRLALVTMLTHSSGQWVRGEVSTKLGKDDAQGVGSAITYLRRYGLSAVLGIVTDDDDDGNGASGKTGEPDRELTFTEAFGDALERRPAGVDQAATMAKAFAALKKQSNMTPENVTVEVGKRLIAALNDGKFDVPVNKQEAA